MTPTDYPTRKPLLKVSDAHDVKTGKGPMTDLSDSRIAPVDTTGFSHRQDVGPGKESMPSMPSVKTPKG